MVLDSQQNGAESAENSLISPHAHPPSSSTFPTRVVRLLEQSINVPGHRIITQSPWFAIEFTIGAVHPLGLDKCRMTRVHYYRANTGQFHTHTDTHTEFIQSCLTLCDPMDCSPPGSSVHGIFPGMNTEVGCRFLLQGIFLTQGLNPSLPHCRQTLYRLSHQGSPSKIQKSSSKFQKDVS